MAIIEVPIEVHVTITIDKIAILYSFEQKAFHIESIKDYNKSNIEATLKKRDHQYRLIAIADDETIASEIIESIRTQFNW